MGAGLAGGAGSFADGARINFGKTFSAAPVVVVNAQDATGKPLVAAAKNEPTARTDATGFTLSLHDRDDQPVTSGAVVQWVALITNPAVNVVARTLDVMTGDPIVFPHPLPHANNVVVILSGYSSLDHVPMVAAPTNISVTGFDVMLTDAYGVREQGTVSYVALEIPPANYYAETALAGAYGSWSGFTPGFDLKRDANVVLCNAQKNATPALAAGSGVSRFGFTLALLDYYGNGVTSAWTNFVVFGFK